MMILVSLVSFGVRWHHLATDGITWRQWRQVCASDTKSAPLMPNWRHRRQISVSDGTFSVNDVKFGVTDVKWRHLTPNDAKWCQLTLKLGIWRRSSSPSVSLWHHEVIKWWGHYYHTLFGMGKIWKRPIGEPLQEKKITAMDDLGQFRFGFCEVAASQVSLSVI